MKSDSRLPFHVLVCWCIVACVSAVSAIALAVLGPRMAPVKTGSPQAFWKIACGVDLDADKYDRWGDAHFVDDNWVAYDVLHLHGSDLYCLRADLALAHFDSVLEALQEAADRKEDTAFVAGFIDWRTESAQDPNARTLLERIKEERHRLLVARDPNMPSYTALKEQEFQTRWQRSKWYWANFIFEWLLLTGLTLFAVWPGLRGWASSRWALHAALIPSLFLLPCWLGYATFSFTSAGPTGGIVYPFMLTLTRGASLTSLDEWIISRFPQILEPLSTPIGTPVALTGMGMPGPTTSVVIGLVLGGIVFALLEGLKRWRNRAAPSEFNRDVAA